MVTEAATCNVTRQFQHDYDEWADSPYFKFRSTYCCGLLEVHGLQSMPTYTHDFSEPAMDDWARHVWAHLAYRYLNKARFGQVFFTYVVESDCSNSCDECCGDGGWYDYDSEEEEEGWIECEYCFGSGQVGSAEVYPVWDYLLEEASELGIPSSAFHECPQFLNPNTGNECQVLMLTVDVEVRDAFRKITDATDYCGDFRHR